jgi:hypothetical protein
LLGSGRDAMLSSSCKQCRAKAFSVFAMTDKLALHLELEANHARQAVRSELQPMRYEPSTDNDRVQTYS